MDSTISEVTNMHLSFFIVNAFTDHPFKGNPAGVVLEADNLDKNTKQTIAANLRCSETAFVASGKKATFDVKFFSPIKEVDLCGHATIATFYALAKSGIYRHNMATIRTNAGIMPVEIRENTVFMEQGQPVFKETDLRAKDIADSLQINESAIGNLPVEAVSTGIFSLNVPIADLRTMQHMQPDFQAVARLCRDSGTGALFAFTFDTINPECFIHARCFAPLYGINEDPVTGTANGALGAYLKKHGLLKTGLYTAEQGCELGRDGMVIVDATDTTVKIGGTAYTALSGELDI